MARRIDQNVFVNIKVKSELDKLAKNAEYLDLVKKAGYGVYESGRSLYKIDEKGNKQRIRSNKDRKEAAIRIKDLSKQQKEQNKEMVKASKALQSFSVTLPLLFGFQSISQGMKSLIDPALQLVGATELYNDFLALKYLPTALDQLDLITQTGDEWLNTDEATRKAEGDMVLFTKQLADAVAYTAQWAQLGAAIGEAIPLIGRSAGAAAGAIFGTSTAIAAMSDESSKLVAQMTGFEAAVGVKATDSLANFANKLGILGEDFGITKENVIDTKEEIDSLGESIKKLPPEKIIDILVNIQGDEELLKYFLEKSGIKPTDLLSSGNINKQIEQSGGGNLELGKSSISSEQTKKLISSGIITEPFSSKAAQFFGGIVSSFGQLSGGLSLPFFQSGGVVPGNPTQPVPIIAHGGETVIPSGSSTGGEVNFNPVYYITTNNNAELERTLREHDNQLIEDVKRIIGI